MNQDQGAGLTEFDGDAGLASLTVAFTSLLSIIGVSNVPVGIYTDNSGTLRHSSNQGVTPPVSTFVGHCGFIFTSGSCVTNMSLAPSDSFVYYGLQQSWLSTCSNNGPDALRCNTPYFSVSSCPAAWINLDGLCYINPANDSTLLAYSDAAGGCSKVGGWLPSFANSNEWNAVVYYAYYTGIAGVNSYTAPMWLGGSLSGTTATWNGGTLSSFSYFASSQPTAASICIWWSVGQESRWSTATSCSSPGVAFCQYYSCSSTTTSTTSTSKSTSTSAISTSTSTSTTTTATSHITTTTSTSTKPSTITTSPTTTTTSPTNN